MAEQRTEAASPGSQVSALTTTSDGPSFQALSLPSEAAHSTSAGGLLCAPTRCSESSASACVSFDCGAQSQRFLSRVSKSR